MLETVRFASDLPGKRLLVLGGVHGNEPCGTLAIRRLIEEFRSGKFRLKSGSLTLVPCCNAQAALLNRRYIDHNLNRAVMRRPAPACHEHQLMNSLCPLLEDCDVLLDIHSYTAGGAPFVVGGPDSHDVREEEMVRLMGIDTIVHDIERAYVECGKAKAGEPIACMADYARAHGATAVSIECAQHKDPKGPEIAYRAIQGAMAFAGLAALDGKEQVSHLRRVAMRRVRFREPGDAFARAWQHMDELEAGEVIGTNQDGEPLLAPFDCFIVMPHATCPVGEEWYYLGVEEEAAAAVHGVAVAEVQS